MNAWSKELNKLFSAYSSACADRPSVQLVNCSSPLRVSGYVFVNDIDHVENAPPYSASVFILPSEGQRVCVITPLPSPTMNKPSGTSKWQAWRFLCSHEWETPLSLYLSSRPRIINNNKMKRTKIILFGFIVLFLREVRRFRFTFEIWTYLFSLSCFS